MEAEQQAYEDGSKPAAVGYGITSKPGFLVVAGDVKVSKMALTGELEALELRNGNKRLAQQGVLKAVANANDTIAPELTCMKVTDQTGINFKMVKETSTSCSGRSGSW